jgi:hypothetical protein
MIDTVREDIIDGLASGEAAQAAVAFSIERTSDGTILAAFNNEVTFAVRVERLV